MVQHRSARAPIAMPPFRLATGLAALALLSSLVAQPAQAWSATGHKIVAQVAWDSMSASSRQRAAALIATLRHPPIQAAFARDQDGDGREAFLEASLWLDQIRASGTHLFDRWHYVNLPIIDPADRTAIQTPAPHEDNAMWAIANARRALAASQEPSDTALAPDTALAMALVTLLHVVGDLHQPMHAVARFDRQHPTGDRGGNDLPLARPWGNLHRLWDGMAGAYAARASDDDIRGWAAALRHSHPATRFPARRKLDPTLWASESHRLATEIAYPGITPGQRPDADYLHRARQASRERLALAGYRLAALLEESLGDSGLAVATP